MINWAKKVIEEKGKNKGNESKPKAQSQLYTIMAHWLGFNEKKGKECDQEN